MVNDNDIKEDEREAIQEVRGKLQGDIDQELYDDSHFLLRFLKVEDFDLNRAEALLRKHMAWREKNDVKNIMKFKKNEVMENYYPYVILGCDKEGCVVRYVPLGSIDVIGVVASLTIEDITKFFIYECELDTMMLREESEKRERNVDQCIYIANFENFTFAAATDKKIIYAILYILRMYINNYPERLKAAYLINVSMYFYIAYAVVKTILPKKLQDKISVYSDETYKEDLLKEIDADVLPAFLGGNKTDPDGNPSCITLIKPPEPVPHKYYLQKSKKSLVEAPDVHKITLGKASFHEEKLEVKEEGSYLEWEFETKCRDIGFGLFYSEMIDDEEKITELVPIQRIDTEAYPETGTWRCERAGTYVIVYDNTYSWVRSKEIYYRTKVVSPKEHEEQLIE